MKRLGDVEQNIKCLGHKNVSVATRARDALGYFGSRAIPSLVSATTSTDPAVRWRAVWAIAEIGGPGAYENLLRMLFDSDEQVQYEAALALGRPRDDRSIELLVSLVRAADSDDILSGPAAYSLAGFGSVGVTCLAGTIQDGTVQAKRVAVYALGSIHSDEVVEAVAQLLRDPDEIIRSWAVEALALYDTPYRRKLVNSMLSDESDLVRRYASEAFAVTGSLE